MILNILLFAAMNEADKKRRKLLANKNRASQHLVAKPLNQTAAVKNGNNKKESRESKKIRDSNTTTLMLIVVITVRHNLTTVMTYYIWIWLRFVPAQISEIVKFELLAGSKKVFICGVKFFYSNKRKSTKKGTLLPPLLLLLLLLLIKIFLFWDISFQFPVVVTKSTSCSGTQVLRGIFSMVF